MTQPAHRHLAEMAMRCLCHSIEHHLHLKTLSNGFFFILYVPSTIFQLNSNYFIWDFGKLPFPEQLGKYFIKVGKIRAKIHEIGKIKAIFGLGMTPI